MLELPTPLDDDGEETPLEFCDIAEVFDMSPSRTAVLSAYQILGDFDSSPSDYAGSFDAERVAPLKAIYDALVCIGYEISDDERGILDGTSDLYYKPDSTEV